MTAEIDLARVVVEWLSGRGWDVYQEVQVSRWGGARADIVARCGRLVYVVEVKTSLSLAVLEQADRWRAHFRAVAVPEPARSRGCGRDFAAQIAGWRRFGILEVGMGRVHELARPPLCREFDDEAQRIAKALRPEHKTAAPAGTNRGGFWTPYAGTMWKIRDYLRARGSAGATLREIMADTAHHYASDKVARSMLPERLGTLESEWCAVVGTGRERRFYLRGTEPQTSA